MFHPFRVTAAYYYSCVLSLCYITWWSNGFWCIFLRTKTVTFDFTCWHCESVNDCSAPNTKQDSFLCLFYNWLWLPSTLASHADVLRLVTRSSPRGEERVKSLRTSAWEAMTTLGARGFSCVVSGVGYVSSFGLRPNKARLFRRSCPNNARKTSGTQGKLWQVGIINSPVPGWREPKNTTPWQWILPGLDREIRTLMKPPRTS